MSGKQKLAAGGSRCAVQQIADKMDQRRRRKTQCRRGRMGYTIAISYQYSVGDEEYIGDRYDFFRSKDQYSSAGEDEKQKIVRNHPAGKTVTCFVNPDNPDEAVICREADTMVVIFSFFPLLFIAAGAGIIIFSVKKLLPPGKQKQ